MWEWYLFLAARPKDLYMCMCTHTCMATKTITIMDDAYTLLLRNKMNSESFSDVIRRFFSRKKSILEFAGAWDDMSEKEAEELKENIKKVRINLNKSIAKKVKENDMS